MYAVYVDGKVMYSPVLSPNDEYLITKALITKELNKAGSFEFTIPPCNLMYDKINKLKSIITVESYDQPDYELKSYDRVKKTSQSSIPTKVLYRCFSINHVTKEITLTRRLNINGSDSEEQWNNYLSYPYFYGDLKDGSEDNTVYKYTDISRLKDSENIDIYMYSFTYFRQEAIKTVKTDILFRGRALYSKKDFYKRKTFFCEGDLAFLLDSLQRPYTFQGDVLVYFKQLLGNHNDQVEPDKRFSIGKLDISDKNNYISRESSVYPTTLDEIKKKLVKTHGGYLKTRMSRKTAYIDYSVESGNVNSQTIEFGSNLLDITEYITAENVCTVLVPLGEKIKDDSGNENGRLTIESVNDGKDYIESDIGISLFGRITKKKEWDDVTIAENLLKKGNEYLNQVIAMSVSLKIRAVDLHLIDVNTESINIGDKIRVISPPHGIDEFFQATKIQLDILNPDNSIYEFGLSFSTLIEKLSKKN